MRRVVALVSVSLLVFGLLYSALPASAWADAFGSGANEFDLQFVRIDQPGNPPDENPNPAGAVPYRYRIGKYEISEQMIDKANAQSALDGDPLGLTKDTRGPDFPATSITWYEAARFANWLNTSMGHMPAYKFDDAGNFQLWEPDDSGFDPANLYRNRHARYFLPSLDEWHKAAYYDPVAEVYYDYPTGSDDIPDGIDSVGDPDFEAVFDDGDMNPLPNEVTDVGLLSPYGTAGQGGNIREWMETAFDRVNDIADEQRKELGGSWKGIYSGLAAWNGGIGISPQFQGDFSGIRVASVIPEPSAFMLFTMGLFVVLALKRRSRV